MVGMDLAVVWPWSTGESRAGISVEGGMSSIAYNTLRLFAVALVAATLAVKVTDSPKTEGLSDDDKLVEVTLSTILAANASSRPGLVWPGKAPVVKPAT